MEQTWLTVDELAAVLKVSPKSIRRAYRKGRDSGRSGASRRRAQQTSPDW